MTTAALPAGLTGQRAARSDEYLAGYLDAVRVIQAMTGGSYDEEVEREACVQHLVNTLVDHGGVHPVDLPRDVL